MTEYPQDWDVAELGNIGFWLSGGTPSTSNPAYWDGHIPWISATSLKSFDIRESERKVTELGANSGTRRVPAGTVIFVVRGMSLKTEFRVGVTSREMTFGQDCKAIQTPVGVNSRFLAYALKANEGEILSMVDEAGHGTGRLPTRQLAQLRIGLPQESEQDQILEALDSADESIRVTGRSLAKLEHVKRSMLADLLRGQHENILLGDLIAAGPQNGLYKPASAYTPDGLAIVRIDSFGDGVIHAIGNLKRVAVDQREALVYRLEPGDILINRVNTPELVGKVALVPEFGDNLLFESNVMRLKVRVEEVYPEFLVHVLDGQHAKAHFRRSAKSAVSQASINQEDVRGCPVVMPSRSDQKKIISVGLGFDNQIANCIDQLKKLHNVKRALMDDLLTGRVRVNTP